MHYLSRAQSKMQRSKAQPRYRLCGWMGINSPARSGLRSCSTAWQPLARSSDRVEEFPESVSAALRLVLRRPAQLRRPPSTVHRPTQTYQQFKAHQKLFDGRTAQQWRVKVHVKVECVLLCPSFRGQGLCDGRKWWHRWDVM